MTAEDHHPLRDMRQAVLEAWHEGVLAARAGVPLAACPHLPAAAAHDRLVALWWLRGHHASSRRGGPAGGRPPG
ncbi:hypothetical protein GGQ22_06670 [Nocardioides sp. zg-579]|uniref:Uncharacterized protein n=1 Tax=Nocardioides marmotae TaxID=2663857 RepID=A0A6I3J5X3_9ACTN|nr:hypothetical protein [Nocardioides marmotae]MCR6031123.1 hypothetical protein [Gordonia jinghuaiqii]MTB94762.1 hypothetical protein [Nocardioides marmotae]QKE01241.1 hypothetical protein HPC71_09305 [Nocardioides marmotae]